MKKSNENYVDRVIKGFLSFQHLGILDPQFDGNSVNFFGGECWNDVKREKKEAVRVGYLAQNHESSTFGCHGGGARILARAGGYLS